MWKAFQPQFSIPAGNISVYHVTLHTNFAGAAGAAVADLGPPAPFMGI